MFLRMSFVSTCLLLAMAASVAAANVTLSDGEFLEADWNNYAIVNGVGSGFSVARFTNGGNPGAYQDSTNNVAPGERIATNHVYQPVKYDPAASGAISQADFSVDVLDGSTSVTILKAYIAQDGLAYYSIGFHAISSSGWTQYSFTGLTDADFDLNSDAGVGSAPFGQHPDFSASGNIISVGYTLIDSFAGTPEQILLAGNGIDNFSATFHSVPEPCSVLLAALGFLGLVARSRWRRKARD